MRHARFSLRSLLIVVTVLCAYLATWMPTATRGVSAVVNGSQGWHAGSPIPLVVGVDQAVEQGVTRRYYVWLLGPVIKLPFESQGVPMPTYLGSGIQYFAPGPEFKLSREAAAMKAYKAEPEALEQTGPVVTIGPVQDGMPTADFDFDLTQDSLGIDTLTVETE